MKIRSLVLGSVAAAGLSTGAFAADLGVLTSLDVCDALGLSGLTISSDTNCLQITGAVSYEFNWGDYEGNDTRGTSFMGVITAGTPANQSLTTTGYGSFDIKTPGMANGNPAWNLDWSSKVEAWIKFVATADSDFGPAKAVIKIKDVQQWSVVNEAPVAGKKSPYDNQGALPAGMPPAVAATFGVPGTGGDHTFGPIFDEAYVSVGDTTVLMAGKKGTIMNFGDDVPLNFLGLFNDEKVDRGVKWTKDLVPDGGHVIQVVSDLGNGISVGAGLENLNGLGASAGTAVGVIAYAGDGIAAHITGVAGGVLDGTIENFAIHAGFSGTFDMFKIVAAIAGDSTGYWNGLASASATFDIFTLAASAEFVRNAAGETDYGVGGSITAAVTDGVTINVGGRWYHDATPAGDDGWQVAAQVAALVTENITLTGEVGVYGAVNAATTEVFYGAAQVAWAPGGGFTSSLKGEVFSNGAYRATFKAARTFE